MLALALTGCAGWTPRDYALQATHVALHIADYQQTRVVTSRCQEQNPMIGRCGDGPVGMWMFPLAVVLNIAVSYVLPAGWRTAWQGVTIGVEAEVVYENYAQGYGI